MWLHLDSLEMCHNDRGKHRERELDIDLLLERLHQIQIERDHHHADHVDHLEIFRYSVLTIALVYIIFLRSLFYNDG